MISTSTAKTIEPLLYTSAILSNNGFFLNLTAKWRPRRNIPDEDRGVVFPSRRNDINVVGRDADGGDVSVMQDVVADRLQLVRVPNDNLNLNNKYSGSRIIM